MSLHDKSILITGGSRRIGRSIALALAQAGARVVLHYNRSKEQALSLLAEIEAAGSRAFLLQADLGDPDQVARIIPRALEYGPLYALINNAALFEPLTWDTTGLADWNRHLAVNLTAPFLLSQAFARSLAPDVTGRIVNILDWRALRPGADHLPYTISKSALAALTHSLAIALAPQVTVTGLALGAILPPTDGAAAEKIVAAVPAHRWGKLEEVNQAILFLLDGPEYMTGGILDLDGGRRLV